MADVVSEHAPNPRRSTRLLPAAMTVVEVGDSIAASMCGRFLHQLGARVIKVEPPTGSPLRSHPPFLAAGATEKSAMFEWLNAGKEFASADVTTAAGREAVEALVRTGVDVILLSGRLEEWEGIGLQPSAWSALAPNRVVVGRVTMFGDLGPYADMTGGDLQAQALGGLTTLIGFAHREPLRLGGSQAQCATGMALLTGVLIGLYGGATSGRDTFFATSVLETVAHLEWKSASIAQSGGTAGVRGSDGGPVIVRCRDGFFAFFFRPVDWAKVKGLIQDPRLDGVDFATHAKRVENQRQLIAVLEDTTRETAKRDLYQRAQEAGLPAGYMATMEDLIESPQYRARDFFDEVDIEGCGRGLLPGAPWQVMPMPANARKAGES